MIVSSIRDLFSAASLPTTEPERSGAGRVEPDRPQAAASAPEPPDRGSEGAEQLRGAREPQSVDAGEEAASRLRERFDEIQARGYLREIRVEHEMQDDGGFLVKVRDARTDKVIRQLPPEELVEFSRRLDETLGILFDEQA